MSYWLGPKAAIEAAQELAFAAYVAAAPSPMRDGVQVDNPTTAWARPFPCEGLTDSPEAEPTWAIPAFPGMPVPEGCILSERFPVPLE